MSNTLAASGTHWVLPEVWRQRFIRRAVEYSRPYMVRSALGRYSDTSQQMRPRSSRVRRMTSLSCCFYWIGLVSVVSVGHFLINAFRNNSRILSAAVANALPVTYLRLSFWRAAMIMAVVAGSMFLPTKMRQSTRVSMRLV